jgi:type IV pilus assembly protein PilC
LKFLHFQSNKLSAQDQLHFAQQLLALMHAGLPLLNAIGLLSRSSSRRSCDWIANLHQKLQQGNSLSYCLKIQEVQFSIEFINLIQVSERSGQLNLALETICEQLESQIELRRKMTQSLSYPVITLSSSLLLLIVMMVWVVPVFKEVFEHFKADLPAPTRALIFTSNLIQNIFFELISVLLIALSGFILFWKKSKRLQKQCDRLSFFIPVIGKLLRLATLTYWCRTLGNLLASRLPLPDALRVTAQSSNHWLSHDLSADIFKHLTRGWPFGEALIRADPKHLLFDIETLHLLEIGAESGSLAEMLRKRSQMLGAQLSNQLNTLSQSLEPLLIIFVGSIIGSLVIILYLPIFNLGQIV